MDTDLLYQDIGALVTRLLSHLARIQVGDKNHEDHTLLRRDLHSLKSLFSYFTQSGMEGLLHSAEQSLAQGTLDFTSLIQNLNRWPKELNLSLNQGPMEQSSHKLPLVPLVIEAPCLPFEVPGQLAPEDFSKIKVLRGFLDPEEPLPGLRLLLIQRKIDECGALLVLESWILTKEGWGNFDYSTELPSSAQDLAHPVFFRAVLLPGEKEHDLIPYLSNDGIFDLNLGAFTPLVACESRLGLYRNPRYAKELGEFWLQYSHGLAEKMGKELIPLAIFEQGLFDSHVAVTLSRVMVQAIRNSLKHGLESPQERMDQGKPPYGILCMTVNDDGANTVVRCLDDGRGLPMDEYDELAMHIPGGQGNLGDLDEHGGMGLGMGIVQTVVEQSLGGTWTLVNRRGRGANLRVYYPRDLTSTSCLLVVANGQTIAIPCVKVLGHMEIRKKDLGPPKHQGQVGTYSLWGQCFDVFELESPSDQEGPRVSQLWPSDTLHLLCFGAGLTLDHGLAVHAVLGQETLSSLPGTLGVYSWLLNQWIPYHGEVIHGGTH